MSSNFILFYLREFPVKDHDRRVKMVKKTVEPDVPQVQVGCYWLGEVGNNHWVTELEHEEWMGTCW